MRRVVITGLGITSCLGLDAVSVTESLRQGRSGYHQTRRTRNWACVVRFQDQSTLISLNTSIVTARFMGNAAAYAYLSLQQAINDAGLEASDVSNPEQAGHGFWRGVITKPS